MEPFDRIGARLDDAWQRADYTDAAFVDLAVRALRDDSPADQIVPGDIVRAVLSGPRLEQQVDLDAQFGQPPITLYRGRGFHISALFWIDGTTSVHEHSFAGAFQVLAGSSLHSQFAFDVDRTINARVMTGRTSLRSVELLRRGDVRPIVRGAAFIHSLFHLDRPSVSIVVRTDGGFDHRPQYQYERPRIARDPFFKDPTSTRWLQLVDMLHSTADPDLAHLVGDLVASTDFHTSHRILERVFDLAGENATLITSLLERARSRHGTLIDDVRSVFAHRARERLIVAKRASVTGAPQRYLLALLLNLTERGPVLEATRAYAPEHDPVDTLVDWLGQLAKLTHKLQVGAVAWEPSLLGLPEMDADAIAILRELLRGRTAMQAAAELAGRGHAHPHAVERRAEELSVFLRNSPIFSPLATP